MCMARTNQVLESSVSASFRDQAVQRWCALLCDLRPLVDAVQDMPKALLPVGNKPVLSYTLEMLEANNLTHPHVVSSSQCPDLGVFSWLRQSPLAVVPQSQFEN
jgi:hypothetical protein